MSDWTSNANPPLPKCPHGLERLACSECRYDLIVPATEGGFGGAAALEADVRRLSDELAAARGAAQMFAGNIDARNRRIADLERAGDAMADSMPSLSRTDLRGLYRPYCLICLAWIDEHATSCPVAAWRKARGQ